MRLSKSKINTYLKCPREFKYRYIDEIETPPNEYMALGSDVHLIAENYAKIYGDNPQENPRYLIFPSSYPPSFIFLGNSKIIIYNYIFYIFR